VANFSTQNATIHSPRNHHNPTTNSPSKNHIQPPVFRKTPKLTNADLFSKIALIIVACFWTSVEKYSLVTTMIVDILLL
jgi:hypothetical protein